MMTLQSLAGCISNLKNPSYGDIDDIIVDLIAGIDISTASYCLFLYM